MYNVGILISENILNTKPFRTQAFRIRDNELCFEQMYMMKKRERLNQNGNKLIYVQNKIVELLTSNLTFEGVQCKPVFL
jgi:hypothetical protein